MYQMENEAPRAEPLRVPDLEQIRGGASANILADLKRLLQVSDLELVAIVGIPRQTMLRRLKQGRLTRHESDRAARLARVYNATLEFFDYNHESAVRWLKHANPALRGETPLEHSDTEVGAEDVLTILHRLAHGIPL